MPDKYMKQVPKTKMRKGDRVYYSNQFGYYVGKQLIHATMPRSSVVPFGCRKGQRLVAIWNPHNLMSGGSSKANVYLPLSKIKKVVRGYQTKVKGSRKW